MLKPRVQKFHDLSLRFKDIAEKQVPAKLKSIVTVCEPHQLERQFHPALFGYFKLHILAGERMGGDGDGASYPL